MRIRHVLLAILVAVIWGVNFVVIDRGLQHFPPLLFGALRFTLVALPAVFLVRRPDVNWIWVVVVGLLIGVGQFGLLFVAMATGLPAGIASLVLQSQALFTLVLAAAVIRERPRVRPVLGTLMAGAGLAVVGMSRAQAIPLLPLLLAVGAGASWGASNVCIRLARSANPLGLLVWSSLVSPLPLLLLSLIVEGPAADLRAISEPSLAGIGALLYIVILATLVGWGAWTWLLGRYPASMVAPFSLLVPIFGVGSAWLLLAERPSALELVGGAAVMVGLVLVSIVPPSRSREASKVAAASLTGGADP